MPGLVGELGRDAARQQDLVGVLERSRGADERRAVRGACAARRVGRRRTRGRRRPSARTLRRPARIVVGPVCPRAQRSAIALASVGTCSTAAARRATSSGPGPHVPRCPPASVTSATRSSTSAGVSSPSQPAPKTASSAATPASCSAGAAARQTASASGLASPASSPWAMTSPPTSTSTTTSQASSVRGVRQPGGDRRGAAAGVQQQHGLAEMARHVRLGEVKAARAGRVGSGERDGAVQRAGAGQLADAPRAGPGVDRPALPGQPADDRGRAEQPRQLGDRQRADDVTAAADADGEDAPGGAERRDQRSSRRASRRGRERRRRRSRRSPRPRDRTRRPTAPACPRRAGRAAAPATSGSRRTRP